MTVGCEAPDESVRISVSDDDPIAREFMTRALTRASAAVEEQRALMGDDYWPYNVKSNRRSLEALTLFAHQQGLTPHRVDYESFFSPEAAALPGA